MAVLSVRNITRGGWALIIGIIVLAALVFGGLYVVRERGEQARRDEAIHLAEEQLNQEASEDIALDTDDEVTLPGDTSNESTTEQQSGSSAATTPTTNQSATNELPQTGADASSIAIAGLVTFAALSCIASTRRIAAAKNRI